MVVEGRIFKSDRTLAVVEKPASHLNVFCRNALTGQTRISIWIWNLDCLSRQQNVSKTFNQTEENRRKNFFIKNSWENSANV